MDAGSCSVPLPFKKHVSFDERGPCKLHENVFGDTRFAWPRLTLIALPGDGLETVELLRFCARSTLVHICENSEWN